MRRQPKRRLERVLDKTAALLEKAAVDKEAQEKAAVEKEYWEKEPKKEKAP